MREENVMSKVILIAEDEPVLRESLAELLAGEGYEVLQAPNGKAAYDAVLQRPVDLVITDVRMPEMDGMQLLDHLQAVDGRLEGMCQALTALGSDYCAKKLPELREEDFAGVKDEEGKAAH